MKALAWHGREGRAETRAAEGRVIESVGGRHMANSKFMDDFFAGKHRQLDDGKPRLSEDDMQRAELGPRGEPGKADPTRMTPQRKKKTPSHIDPGHTS